MIDVSHAQARAEVVKRLPGCHVTGIAIRNPLNGGHYLVAYGTGRHSADRLVWIFERVSGRDAYDYQQVYVFRDDTHLLPSWVRRAGMGAGDYADVWIGFHSAQRSGIKHEPHTLMGEVN